MYRKTYKIQGPPLPKSEYGSIGTRKVKYFTKLINQNKQT